MFPCNENWVVKNKLAYTEDDVLVHNIYVYNLEKYPRHLKGLINIFREEYTEEDVRCYFTQFGKVKSVHKKWDTASVRFKHARSAYKALVHTNHEMGGSCLIVEAGVSWKQPDADKVLGRTGRSLIFRGANELQDVPNTTSEPPSNALTLLSLNDDCLEIICGVLELRDQVNFARVCPRFNNVFKMFCKRKYKELDFLKMSSMTLWEKRDFLRFTGEYIEEVGLNSEDKNGELTKPDQMNQKRIIKFIQLFCKNLKCITLIEIALEPDALINLLRSCTKLIELRLLHCDLFLTELKDLIKICKAMKNLKSLDVRYCESLISKFYETMADHCLELEVLKMPLPHFSVDCVARLPCIKHLEFLPSPLFLHNTLKGTLLTELVAHKADQLESLKCFFSLTADEFTAISELKQLKIFYCDRSSALRDEALRKLSKLELLEELMIKSAWNVTNEALLELLQNCTRLHLLDIERCTISTQFIAEAIDILKNRKEKSTKPLTIFARYTSIKERALAKCPIYESALNAGIIKVVFRPYEGVTFYYGYGSGDTETGEEEIDDMFQSSSESN